MKKNKILLAYISSFFIALTAFSNDSIQLVQVSGFAMTADSLMGVPYTHIIIKGTNRGTISGNDGYFSFVAEEGDTILFSSVGYKLAAFELPGGLEDNKVSIIQILTTDTFYISETVIYPWPSKVEFKQAFLDLNIPDDDLARAKKNLDKEKLAELAAAMEMDADENLDNYLRADAKRYYYYGQAPPIQLLNPFAWAEFIKAWKDGKFKRKNRKNERKKD